MSHEAVRISDSDIPFGRVKRDWTMLWRLIMLGFGLFSSIMTIVILYAGTAYIKSEASAAVINGLSPVQIDVKELLALPPRVKYLEEWSQTRVAKTGEWEVWRAKKDEIDTRIVTLIETQQQQLIRQQLLLDALIVNHSH